MKLLERTNRIIGMNDQLGTSIQVPFVAEFHDYQEICDLTDALNKLSYRKRIKAEELEIKNSDYYYSAIFL